MFSKDTTSCPPLPHYNHGYLTFGRDLSLYFSRPCNITYRATVVSYGVDDCSIGIIQGEHHTAVPLALAILLLGAFLSFCCVLRPGWTCLERINTGWGCRQGRVSAKRVALERKQYSVAIIMALAVLVCNGKWTFDAEDDVKKFDLGR